MINKKEGGTADKELNRLSFLLYFFTFAVETGAILIQQENITQYFKIISLSIVMVTLIIFYMKMNSSKIFEKKNIGIIIASGYIVSLACVLASFEFSIYNFWIIGVILISMITDVNLGLIFNLFFSFLLCIISGMTVEVITFYFVLGSVACVLSQYIIKKSTVIYSIIILCSVNVSLEFIINNFVYEEAISVKLLFSSLSILVVVLIIYIIGNIYLRHLKEDSDDYIVEETVDNPMDEDSNNNIKEDNIKEDNIKEDNIKEDNIKEIISDKNENNDITMSLDEKVETGIEKELAYDKKDISLEELSSIDNELLLKLKNISDELYQHCIDIGEISYRAAICVGANEMIARVGGLYHEIGRLNANNYIEEGVAIARENNFPEEVIDIIKQHNSKYEKPCSVEAAIVMLTDSVISTIEYMEKNPTDKGIVVGKIIDNVFNIRLTKGTLDQSGLKITQFKSLREFYKKNFF